MSLKHLLAISGAIVSLAFHGGPAASQQVIPKSVAALGSDIHAVVSGGYWSRGSAEGFFRAVVVESGIEHVSQRLYLQWIKVDPDKNVRTIAISTSIKEINSSAAPGRLIVVVRDDKAEFGTLRMIVTVKPARSGKQAKYVLTAGGTPGGYKMRRLR